MRRAVRSRITHSDERGGCVGARAVAVFSRCVVLALAFLLIGVARAGAQHRVPNGWEEGLFDVAVTGLPPSSVTVLVTPRGKFLLPVQTMLDPLAVPYRVSADSGVLRIARPAGVGTASLWWKGGQRVEVTSVAPIDSDDVYVDGTSVFVAANRLAELIEGTIDVDVGTLAIEIKRESGFPAQIK